MLFQRNYITSVKALNLPAETKFASADFVTQTPLSHKQKNLTKLFTNIQRYKSMYLVSDAPTTVQYAPQPPPGGPPASPGNAGHHTTSETPRHPPHHQNRPMQPPERGHPRRRGPPESHRRSPPPEAPTTTNRNINGIKLAPHPNSSPYWLRIFIYYLTIIAFNGIIYR